MRLIEKRLPGALRDSRPGIPVASATGAAFAFQCRRCGRGFFDIAVREQGSDCLFLLAAEFGAVAYHLQTPDRLCELSAIALSEPPQISRRIRLLVFATRVMNVVTAVTTAKGQTR